MIGEELAKEGERWGDPEVPRVVEAKAVVNEGQGPTLSSAA